MLGRLCFHFGVDPHQSGSTPKWKWRLVLSRVVDLAFFFCLISIEFLLSLWYDLVFLASCFAVKLEPFAFHAWENQTCLQFKYIARFAREVRWEIWDMILRPCRSYEKKQLKQSLGISQQSASESLVNSITMKQKTNKQTNKTHHRCLIVANWHRTKLDRSRLDQISDRSKERTWRNDQAFLKSLKSFGPILGTIFHTWKQRGF